MPGFAHGGKRLPFRPDAATQSGLFLFCMKDVPMKAPALPALLLACALAVPGCKSAPEKPAVAAPPVTAVPATPDKPAAQKHEAKIVSLPFRVDVTFSAKALTLLQETGGLLGVTADYYGAPKNPSADGLDPDLGVWLGGEMETIGAAPRSLTMKGQFDAARVAREVAGDPRVQVTAHAVRSPQAQDKMVCAGFDEALPIAVETGGTVHCTLKGE
jgi:hypothetical protein